MGAVDSSLSWCLLVDNAMREVGLSDIALAHQHYLGAHDLFRGWALGAEPEPVHQACHHVRLAVWRLAEAWCARAP